MICFTAGDNKDIFNLSVAKKFQQSHFTFLSDLYKLTDEVLGQGAYAKVQGCINLQNGQDFAVKVTMNIWQHVLRTIQNKVRHF